MKWKPLIVFLGILLAAFLLFPIRVYRLIHPPTSQDVVQQVFKGNQVFDIFTSSQQVTAQLLHKVDDYPDLEKLSSYKKEDAVPVSPTVQQTIKKLLSSPKSYQWDSDNKCTPDYGVLLNFSSGGQTVRIALCFRCDLLGVFIGKDDSKTKISRKWFKSVRKPMIEVVKSTFPNDKEIQALK